MIKTWFTEKFTVLVLAIHPGATMEEREGNAKPRYTEIQLGDRRGAVPRRGCDTALPGLNSGSRVGTSKVEISGSRVGTLSFATLKK